MKTNKTLHAGIDVGSRKNALCIIDESGNTVGKVDAFKNNLPGAEKIEAFILTLCKRHKTETLIIGTEATNFYDFHLLTFLSSSEQLASFSPMIYRINPKLINGSAKIGRIMPLYSVGCVSLEI